MCPWDGVNRRGPEFSSRAPESETSQNSSPSTPSAVVTSPKSWLSKLKKSPLYLGVTNSIAATIVLVIATAAIAPLWNGPDTYKVYFVGALEEKEVKRISDAFVHGGELGKINGVPVDIEKVDDLGDPASAQQVAADIARRPDTLMVVGHVYSTQTREALPSYLRQVRPTIPVLLTTETNPSLIPPRTALSSYDPVFRLSPDDAKQAEVAAQFAVSRHAVSFWVVEDTANPVYSSFLAHQFVQQIHRDPMKKVLLISTNLNMPSIEVLRSLRIEWVFFAGEWQNALILVRQLRAMSAEYKIKGILLSDGSVDRRLLELGGDDVEGVYLTHPMSVTQYDKEGYSIYGADGFAVVSQLLEETNRRFPQLAARRGGIPYRIRRLLRMRRISDARNALVAEMRMSVQNNHKFLLSDGSDCQFNVEGIRNDATFHVWTISNRQFKQVQ